jgi:hypothetical protein
MQIYRPTTIDATTASISNVDMMWPARVPNTNYVEHSVVTGCYSIPEHKKLAEKGCKGVIARYLRGICAVWRCEKCLRCARIPISWNLAHPLCWKCGITMVGGGLDRPPAVRRPRLTRARGHPRGIFRPPRQRDLFFGAGEKQGTQG